MKKRFLPLVFLLPLLAMGQSNSVSPYSRFGLGDMVNPSFMQGFTMGQLSTALRDPLNLNLNNPAASNALRLTTLEMSGRISIVDQSANGLQTIQQTTSNFNYFAMGIPISENYGLSFGVLPFSAVGYRLSETEELDNIGEVRRQYEGSGGLNKIYLNQALLLFDRLSVGVQLSYYFGSIDYRQDVRYNDASFLSSRYNRNYLVSDVNASFGLQYIQPLGNDKELILGARWEQNNDLATTFTQAAYTYTAIGSQALPRDTLSSESSSEALKLPNQFSFGLSIGARHPDISSFAWMVGFDYGLAEWSRFVGLEASPQELINSDRFSLGGEILPRYAFRNLYRSRDPFSGLKYRVGAYAYRSPMELKGNRISTLGMTFGIGIPLRIKGLAPGEERNNTINLGFNYAQRGTLNDGLIKEEITQIIFGVTLNDRWFIKYKYR